MRDVDCSGRADAQLKEPKPLWCYQLPAVQCDRHYVHVKRVKQACMLLEGRCDLGSRCKARGNSTAKVSRPKMQEETELQQAATRWLAAALPDAMAAGQPGMRLRHGFPDLFIYEAGASGEHGLGVEFKLSTTRLSAAQRQTRNQLNARGYSYRVVRSLPEFRLTVRDYLPVFPGATGCYSGLVDNRGRPQTTCNRLPHNYGTARDEARRLQPVDPSSVVDVRHSRASAFGAVFSKKLWGVGAKKRILGHGAAASGRHGGTGAASTLPATVCTREALVRVLQWVASQSPERRPLSLLDVPCGDMSWMPTLWREYHQASQAELKGERAVPDAVPVPANVDGTVGRDCGGPCSAVDRSPVVAAPLLDYHGLDIAAPLIEQHRASPEISRLAAQYAVRPYFEVSDIVSTPLTQPYDLVFTKDMTIHLSTLDALDAFRHIAASGSRFMLATTNPSILENHELPGATARSYSKPGAGRDLNLELPPFNFSAPLCRSIQFRPTGAQMHLWDLHELRSILVRS